ncbi:nitrogen fixation protein NifZ [Burkholderia vietnamiensis]|uniref:nitrogen fixation protein NifZ n=1 Tax=Burkholderia vietnamiensis TaxID=60552 RepID=UPI000D7830E5|nr:nitrogen fixation protein NifZ [Burkholderia vietnamiensis]GBH24257.1 hypothetical protein BvRS1_13060 [Burkholderia vietnamiensis]
MADINRDDDVIEVAHPPRFSFGGRVVARSAVRNAGTYSGKGIGEVLVNKGDVGYVTSINTFLQQFYIYAVDFGDPGHRVGMRAKELCTLDNLPDDVVAKLGAHASRLGELGRAVAADGPHAAAREEPETSS